MKCTSAAVYPSAGWVADGPLELGAGVAGDAAARGDDCVDALHPAAAKATSTLAKTFTRVGCFIRVTLPVVPRDAGGWVVMLDPPPYPGLHEWRPSCPGERTAR
jgi:hypothetical protein